jgi:hypothetical protein
LTTGENQFNYLKILNIEADLTKTINFKDIIKHFSSQKSRKKLKAIDYFIIYN